MSGQTHTHAPIRLTAVADGRFVAVAIRMRCACIDGVVSAALDLPCWRGVGERRGGTRGRISRARAGLDERISDEAATTTTQPDWIGMALDGWLCHRPVTTDLARSTNDGQAHKQRAHSSHRSHRCCSCVCLSVCLSHLCAERFDSLWSGRGLGGLAPLGRPALPPTGMSNSLSSLDSLSSLGGSGLGGASFAKPKLGGLGSLGGSSSISPRSSGLSPVHAARSLNASTSLSNSHSASSSAHSSASSASATAAAAAAAASRIRPLRFGVRFDPPTLALEYRDLKYPSRRLSRMRTFDLEAEFSAEVAALRRRPTPAAEEALARRLAQRFPHYLADTLVPHAQLVRLVRKSLSRGTGSGGGSSHAQSTIGGRAGRGRLSSLSASQSASASMEESLSHSALDDELEASHDDQHQQQQRQPQRQHYHRSDEEEVEVDHDEEDAEGDDADGLYHPSASAGEDLNTVSEAELARKKAEMNRAFEANALRPDDPDYVYDKQIEFQPTEESEWD